MAADLRTRLPDGRAYHSDPDILGGMPVFVGTRVPVETLMEWLRGGYTLEQFLENFPTVTREQALAFLDEVTEAALARVG